MKRIVIFILFSLGLSLCLAQERISVPATAEVRQLLKTLKMSNKVIFAEVYSSSNDYDFKEVSEVNRGKILSLIMEFYINEMSIEEREAKTICEMIVIPLHNVERELNETSIQLFSFVTYKEIVDLVKTMSLNNNAQEYITKRELYETSEEVQKAYSSLLGIDLTVDQIVSDVKTEEPVTVKEELVTVKEELVTIIEEPVTVKEEPVTVKEEPVTVKEEPVTVKEEPVTVKEEPVTVKTEEHVSDQLAKDIMELGFFAKVIEYLTNRQQRGELLYGSLSEMQQDLSNCYLVMASQRGRQRISAVLLPGEGARLKYGTAEKREISDFSPDVFTCICILIK